MIQEKVSVGKLVLYVKFVEMPLNKALKLKEKKTVTWTEDSSIWIYCKTNQIILMQFNCHEVAPQPQS